MDKEHPGQGCGSKARERKARMLALLDEIEEAFGGLIRRDTFSELRDLIDLDRRR